MKINWLSRCEQFIKVFVFAGILFIAGCAATLSTLISGGHIVESDYVPNKILITYQPIDLGGDETIFYLIETSKGPAIYETVNGKPSAVYEMHWDDVENDYFGSYIGRNSAWRFVVPKDRTKDAKRYYYAFRGSYPFVRTVNGGFEIHTIDGVKQIIEKDPSASVPKILSPN